VFTAYRRISNRKQEHTLPRKQEEEQTLSMLNRHDKRQDKSPKVKKNQGEARTRESPRKRVAGDRELHIKSVDAGDRGDPL